MVQKKVPHFFNFIIFFMYTLFIVIVFKYECYFFLKSNRLVNLKKNNKKQIEGGFSV